jgi:Mn-dependent DtxR family transcriptional regulator
MAKHEIAPDLRRFILTSIASVPHIEALMLARASAPERWTVEGAARRLYIQPVTVRSVMADLCRSGMLLRDEAQDAWYYQRQATQLCDLVERLADLYASHLVEVTGLIHLKLDRKAQQFANAFNRRKD